jgi:hypothetical protein
MTREGLAEGRLSGGPIATERAQPKVQRIHRDWLWDLINLLCAGLFPLALR